MNENLENICNDDNRLKLTDSFKFTCKKSLPCFNKCCADINIVLTPYDIIRLKQRLKITSQELLNTYTVIPFNKQQKLPVVLIKMLDDENKICPFLGEQGCTVYEDRPWACRMYPVGLAAHESNNKHEEYYFLLKEDGCEGFNEQREITIQDWIKEQEIEPYNKMGELFNSITMHKAMLAGKDLEPGQMEMFFLVCYNLDKFRKFIFESSFLSKFKLSSARQKKMKTDDIELLKFGYDWLKFSLFNEKTIDIKEDILKAKKSELKKTKVK